MKNAIHIELTGLRKSYGNNVVLKDVSLSIARGSFTTLLGPSGCGKTTLLRSLAGLNALDAGTILIDGVDVTNAPPHTRNAVLVFQDYALFPHLTVAQNVAYGLKLRKENRSCIQEKLSRTLSYIGIAALADRSISQLSGGQQQRVALARALVMEPDVLLLDEPLSNLDAKLRLTIRAELRRIQQDLGITTVYVTHDQAEALSLSDQIAVMNEGRIVQLGSPRDIYFKPYDAFVAGFMGTANLLCAQVVSYNGVYAEVLIGKKCFRMQTTQTPSDAFAKHAGWSAIKPGDTVDLCLRPESLRILDGGSVKEQDLKLQGSIIQSMFEGNHTRYWVACDGISLVVDDFSLYSERPRGSRIDLAIAFENIHVLAVSTNEPQTHQSPKALTNLEHPVHNTAMKQPKTLDRPVREPTESSMHS